MISCFICFLLVLFIFTFTKGAWRIWLASNNREEAKVALICQQCWYAVRYLQHTAPCGVRDVVYFAEEELNQAGMMASFSTPFQQDHLERFRKAVSNNPQQMGVDVIAPLCMCSYILTHFLVHSFIHATRSSSLKRMTITWFYLQLNDRKLFGA